MRKFVSTLVVKHAKELLAADDNNSKTFRKTAASLPELGIEVSVLLVKGEHNQQGGAKRYKCSSMWCRQTFVADSSHGSSAYAFCSCCGSAHLKSTLNNILASDQVRRTTQADYDAIWDPLSD